MILLPHTYVMEAGLPWRTGFRALAVSRLQRLAAAAKETGEFPYLIVRDGAYLIGLATTEKAAREMAAQAVKEEFARHTEVPGHPGT